MYGQIRNPFSRLTSAKFLVGIVEYYFGRHIGLHRVFSVVLPTFCTVQNSGQE